MKVSGVKSLIVFVVSILLFAQLSFAATQTVSFPESTQSSQSKTITIPGLVSVDSVTVNTGTVTKTVSGEQITINVSGGSPSRTTQGTTTATDSRTSSSNSFPATISYSSGGYSGTLNKSGSSFVASGSYTPSDSKTVTSKLGPQEGTSFPASITYNSGGYSGTLTKSGSYYTDGSTQLSKTGTGSLTSSTNSFSNTYAYSDWQGYSGNIPKSGSSFVISGTASSSKTASGSTTRTANIKTHDGVVDLIYIAPTIPYSDAAGYSGTLSYIGWSANGYTNGSGTSRIYVSSSSPSGHVLPTKSEFETKISELRTNPNAYNIRWDGNSYLSGSTWFRRADCDYTFDKPVVKLNYSGTVIKPDTRLWQQNYSGTVYKTASSYSQNYSGTVTKPASDTRVWQQNYSGTVYGSSTNYYAYTVTVSYTADSSAPTVSSTDPAAGAAGVDTDKTITVTFSEDITQGSAFGSITLKKGSSDVPATKSISGRVLTIDPSSDLAENITYILTIPSSAVKDLSGNTLAAQYTLSFKTLITSQIPPESIKPFEDIIDGSIEVGDVVSIGTYNGTSLTWSYLGSGYFTMTRETFLALNHKMTFKSGGGNQWVSSDINTWLNGSFYNNAFTTTQKSEILYVSLLTLSHFEDLISVSNEPLNYTDKWWLRSLYPGNTTDAYCIGTNGTITHASAASQALVRPMLRLKLTEKGGSSYIPTYSVVQGKDFTFTIPGNELVSEGQTLVGKLSMGSNTYNVLELKGQDGAVMISNHPTEKQGGFTSTGFKLIDVNGKKIYLNVIEAPNKNNIPKAKLN